MIHPRKNVRRVVSAGNQTRVGEWAGKSDLVQVSVDLCDSKRIDRNDRRIVATGLLEIGKEKSSAGDNWTAEARAVLRLRERIFIGGKGVTRVQALVTKKT